MSEDNVLDFLREQFKRVHARFDKIELEAMDERMRLSAMEGHMRARVTSMVSVTNRMDRFEERLSRIERCLDPVESH